MSLVRRTWRETWKAKEYALLHLRAGRRSNSLPALSCGERVFIQNQTGNYPLTWDKVGTIMEVLTFDRCVVPVCGSGRLTTPNRRFLRIIRRTQLDRHTPTHVKSLLLTCHPLHPTPLLVPALPHLPPRQKTHFYMFFLIHFLLSLVSFFYAQCCMALNLVPQSGPTNLALVLE